jgi:hypothetical protein
MGEYAEFFKFAAKAGALEGYLYEREKIEPLSNWVSNMQVMYDKLPADVKKEIKEEYSTVLTRILHNGEKVLNDEIKSKLTSMLSELGT